MGHVFAVIELSNPSEPELVPIKAKALVETSALMLCIPQYLALHLKLESESVREVSVWLMAAIRRCLMLGLPGEVWEAVLLCGGACAWR